MVKEVTPFVTINGFPNYEINQDGVIRNKKEKTTFKTKKPTVGLYKDDEYQISDLPSSGYKRVKKSIDKLVYEHFNIHLVTVHKTEQITCEFCHNSVKCLTQHKKTSNCQDVQSLLLHKACKENDIERAKYICKKGYLVSLCTDTFQKVCENGHLETVKWLWESFRYDLKSYNSYFMSDYHGRKVSMYDKAFYESCDNGHIDVAKWLVSLFPEKYQLGDNDEPIILEN
jgi:hypothetical protein